MNTLAQALIKVRDTRTPEELEQFVNKIRVYDVLGQDDAGAWIVRNNLDETQYDPYHMLPASSER